MKKLIIKRLPHKIVDYENKYRTQNPVARRPRERAIYKYFQKPIPVLGTHVILIIIIIITYSMHYPINNNYLGFILDSKIQSMFALCRYTFGTVYTGK